MRWLREWAPQWFTVPVGKNTLDTTQDETDLDQTAVGTLTSVLGNSRVNTLRLARTWEHWWHGNECFRAQGPAGGQAGFEFGAEPAGNQALCAPQLNYLEYLGQASTESQGPWDSNYQIEDDYSWFLPGKHGDHDMKFGFRYNYTRCAACRRSTRTAPSPSTPTLHVRCGQSTNVSRAVFGADRRLRGERQEPHL